MLPYRTPAYVGAGGVGGALVSALFNSVTAPPHVVAPTCEAYSGASPYQDLASLVLARTTGPLLVGACLGAFLLLFSFVLGLICGGLLGIFGVLFCCRSARPLPGHHGWTRVAGYLRSGGPTA